MNLLIFFLLMHLMKNNNLLFIRLIKSTRATREIFNAMVDKNKIETKTLL